MRKFRKKCISTDEKSVLKDPTVSWWALKVSGMANAIPRLKLGGPTTFIHKIAVLLKNIHGQLS